MELFINGIRFSSEYFKGEQLNSPPLSNYEYNTLNFINDWLSDRETFQLKTSGSTGVPKEIGAPRTLLELSAQNTISFLGLQPSYNALICLNIDFIAGKMMLVRSLVQQMNMFVLAPSLNPFEVYQEDFDFAAVVPLQLEKWLQVQRYVDRINRWKKIIVGGAALSVSLRNKCLSLTPDLYETYGMTETISHIALKNIKTESFFTTVYDDLCLDIDERSCLKIKGEITGNKWLHTNDIVDLIDHKRFVFKGRADFVINSGGIKISPEEIEVLIAENLKINYNFVVSSVPDEVLGEALVLVLERSEEILLQFDFLDKYKRPKTIIRLAEFPLTNSGKIDRMKIKKIIFTS